MEFDINFTDITMLEANGNFSEVCQIMKKEIEESQTSSKKDDWMIRSKVTILSNFGYCAFNCHFYKNGKIYISDYSPSSKDVYNVDVKCLTYWANEYGWKTPEPLSSTVESWLPFWKKEWETHMVDSEFLDKKYGIRKEMQFDPNMDTDDIDDIEE